MSYGREQKASPMDVRPVRCACGEAAVARATMSDPVPMCHVCRLQQVKHPDWAPDQVAKAGKKRWQELDKEASKVRKD